MKPDVLTITTLIFITGVLMSSFNVTSHVSQSNDVSPPPALHQGVTFANNGKLN